MFKKYPSIENTYRKKSIEIIKSVVSEDQEFAVLEKIHGANFSFWSDGVKVTAAKRSGPIETGSSFYNCWPVVERYKKDVLALTRYLIQRDGVESVAVFGELCGGAYNHPDVEKFNVKAVQKGVQYCPNQEFIAFDVMVDGKFIDFHDAFITLSSFEIPTAPVMHTGYLDECLDFMNEFQTNVPEIFDLPPIEGNTCEGVVVRPVNEITLPNGNRLILKNKNEKFSEKKSEPQRPRKPVEAESELLILMKRKLEAYINENRLLNAISKLGEMQRGDFSKMVRILSNDALEEFTKDENEMLNTAEKSDIVKLKKYLGSQSVGVVKEFIKTL